MTFYMQVRNIAWKKKTVQFMSLQQNANRGCKICIGLRVRQLCLSSTTSTYTNTKRQRQCTKLSSKERKVRYGLLQLIEEAERDL